MHEMRLMIFMIRPAQPFATIDAVFDATAPFRTHALAVTHGHVLHVEESGNADGIPALVLHGGPGSGLSPLLARGLDPRRFRIVGLDQRGAGRSTPAGDTVHNTTALLLDDLQALRRHLGIARWLVVGGSWGATLALAHALHEPQAVQALLLRAVFLARQDDIDTFFAGSGVAWQRMGTAPAGEARTIALAWRRHEQARAGVAPVEPTAAEADALVQRYRIQSHYLQHRCWLDAPPLLQRCADLPPVPTLLLHGAADHICPPEGARALQRAAPHIAVRFIDSAGHDPTHPALAAATAQALDRYARSGRFDDGEALPA
jgi:proline iminopeptidase